MKRKFWFFLGGLFLLVLVTSAFAQSIPITNGLNYLSSSQNPDGSWGNPAGGGTATTTPLPATVSVIETLRVLNETTPQRGYTNGLLWVKE